MSLDHVSSLGGEPTDAITLMVSSTAAAARCPQSPPAPAVRFAPPQCRPRVLTFLHSFEPGGVERIALRMIRQWRRMGIEAPLFMGREDGPLRGELARDLAYEAPPQPAGGTASWETLWMILKLPAAIRRYRPDVLFVAGSTYTVVAVAMRLILGRDCPAIVVKISNDLARRDLHPVGRFFWRVWLRLQARSADRWVLMDESMAQDLPAAMAARRMVIHDPALDRPRPVAVRTARAPGPRRFAAIGRLVHQKDFGLMLRAFALGAGEGETLTIFGDGPERDCLLAQASALGLDGRVTFAGHVPDAASHLPAFDILLMSSRYEGIPAVVLEGLAAGLALVSTDCGAGVRSLLGDGRFGRVVPRDETALAAAIADPDLAPADPEQLAHHLARFTVERAAAAYADAFAEAAQARALATDAQPAGLALGLDPQPMRAEI